MKRISRLVFDIIGFAFIILSLSIGIYVMFNSETRSIRGFSQEVVEKITNFNNKSFIDDLRKGDNAHWLAVSGLMVATVGMILFLISLLLIFKKTSHTSVTIAIYVVAVISLSLTLFGLITQFNITNFGGLSKLVNEFKV